MQFFLRYYTVTWSPIWINVSFPPSSYSLLHLFLGPAWHFSPWSASADASTGYMLLLTGISLWWQWKDGSGCRKWHCISMYQGKEKGRTIRKELYHADARSGVYKPQSKLWYAAQPSTGLPDVTAFRQRICLTCILVYRAAHGQT